jgi:hypothetical protein
MASPRRRGFALTSYECATNGDGRNRDYVDRVDSSETAPQE